MGVSTDGILCFGVDLGEDERWPCGYTGPDGCEEVDFGEYLAKLHGHKNPWDEVPHWGWSMEEFDTYKKTHPAWVARLDAWYAIRKELEEAAPIEIVTHCSLEYPMYIVALRGKVYKAWRGDPTIISPARLEITPAEVGLAQEFCKRHALPAFQEPRWLLASLWA